ncbi:MAG: cobalt transport protein [Lachnospiraceae bacterium]|nr:cobalt transport protein [Lachnospiraceae bacterium]
MRDIKEYNPVAVLIYYMSAVLVSMFTMNPVLHIISFAGGLIQFLIIPAKGKLRTHIWYFLIGLILATVRPLFSHNGATVLFIINDNPITKEAFIFGLNSAVMVVGVLYLFRVFSEIMTSDRLLYVFGKTSPKSALIMSMGLKFIPMLRRQRKITADAQTAIGMNKDDNAIDRIRGGLNVFSATVSWGLENGIITADSMAARGYGECKRTVYSRYSFKKRDALLIGISLGLLTPVITAIIKGSFDTVFYPLFTVAKPDVFSATGYISYAILMMIPVILKLLETFRWKYLMSKI